VSGFHGGLALVVGVIMGVLLRNLEAYNVTNLLCLLYFVFRLLPALSNVVFVIVVCNPLSFLINGRANVTF
jgi:hypothetical protein